jgi:HK97 family phage prohead protease
MLFRAYEADLTVRGDGRTVYGYAVPYDVDAIVNDGFGDYAERFTHGAFRNVIRQAHRCKFQCRHDDDVMSWVGNAVLLREEKRGLFGEWQVDNTDRGRQVIYKIRDGQLPGLSVGYRPSDRQTHNTLSVREDGIQRITRSLVKQLDHVAAVVDPAFAPVEPLAVREARQESSVDHWRKWRAGLMVNEDRRT